MKVFCSYEDKDQGRLQREEGFMQLTPPPGEPETIISNRDSGLATPE